MNQFFLNFRFLEKRNKKGGIPDINIDRDGNMKIFEGIADLIESLRRTREILKLRRVQREAWARYSRDTAAMHERFQEWQSRKWIEAHMRRQAGLPKDRDICPDRLTRDAWLRENPHIVKPKKPERLEVAWM